MTIKEIAAVPLDISGKSVIRVRQYEGEVIIELGFRTSGMRTMQVILLTPINLRDFVCLCLGFLGPEALLNVTEKCKEIGEK